MIFMLDWFGSVFKFQYLAIASLWNVTNFQILYEVLVQI